MKKQLILISLVCISLPLLADTDEFKQMPAFSDKTCNIQSYSTLHNLKDSEGKNISYNTKTIVKIEELLLRNGYHPVASIHAEMSLDISIAFNPLNLQGAGITNQSEYGCWNIDAVILKNGTPKYKQEYSACRSTKFYQDKVFKKTNDYKDKIDFDALYNHKYYDPDGVNSSGYSLSDSVDSVLLGVGGPVVDEYELRSGNLCLLERLPHCCTPQDDSNQCKKLRGELRD